MADEAENTAPVVEETKKSGFNPLLLLIPVLIVGLVVSFGAKSSKEEPKTPEVATTGDAQTGTVMGEEDVKGSTASKTADATDVKEITMKAGSFFFDPKEIKVKFGQKVKINFEAVDMMHNFMIDELGVKTEPIKGGNKMVVEFTADKKGTFEYYCSVGQHRKNGQVGKLIVE